jgi:hypothetical protein
MEIGIKHDKLQHTIKREGIYSKDERHQHATFCKNWTDKSTSKFSKGARESGMSGE